MNYTSKLFNLVILIFASEIMQAQYQVGHYNVVFQDSDRSNRNIETEIYYPAISQGDNVQAVSGQFPVIIFGHGFVIPWSDYQIFWEELVSLGYIMVFPRTEGSLLSTNHQDFGWDLQFLVLKIQEEGNNFESPINGVVANNTALMGHSMGGGALFLAADSLCVNENEQLKTIIALAPAESTTNGVSSIASASNITVPALILSGSQDGVTPPSEHHIPMYENLLSDCKTFISISGGAHCYFANSNLACDVGETLSSTGILISREQQQTITLNFLTLWLDYSLNNDCDDFVVFQDSLSNSNSITYDQVCLQGTLANIFNDQGILTSTINGLDYQWYLDGNIIMDANEINYVPIYEGEYTVEVFFLNGCSTMSNSYYYSIQLSSYLELFPASYIIHQNNPNPFNPTTQINYELPNNDYVTIDIFNVMGHRIKSLVSTNQYAGYKSVHWNATNDLGQPVSAGMYIYTIQAGEFRQTRKMVLIK